MRSKLVIALLNLIHFWNTGIHIGSQLTQSSPLQFVSYFSYIPMQTCRLGVPACCLPSVALQRLVMVITQESENYILYLNALSLGLTALVRTWIHIPTDEQKF